MWIPTRVLFWSILLVLLLTACSAVGNRARIDALQDEFESSQFPYDVELDEENVTLAGPNLELDTNELNRIVGYAELDHDMFTVADETLEWLPTAGWEQVITRCNGMGGEVTAAFMRGAKLLGEWEAQISLSVNQHPNDDLTVFSVLMDAPPAGEETLPPLNGEVEPCWRD